MDFEEQWKEQFYLSYLESVKQGRDKQPKPSIGILQAIKKKIKWT
jgi:hypothetical protein